MPACLHAASTSGSASGSDDGKGAQTVSDIALNGPQGELVFGRGWGLSEHDAIHHASRGARLVRPDSSVG
nr:hypothetical protein HmN_000130600 [Hymenolepis microstoma]